MEKQENGFSIKENGISFHYSSDNSSKNKTEQLQDSSIPDFNNQKIKATKLTGNTYWVNAEYEEMVFKKISASKRVKGVNSSKDYELDPSLAPIAAIVVLLVLGFIFVAGKQTKELSKEELIKAREKIIKMQKYMPTMTTEDIDKEIAEYDSRQMKTPDEREILVAKMIKVLGYFFLWWTVLIALINWSN